MVENTTLKVKKITRINKSTRVINFTCAPYPYYYANGILSHNCDAWYTSWKPEHSENPINYKSIFDVYTNNPQITHTMITGGGPTLQSELLVNLCDLAKQFNHHVTI